jgi:hypothetical protein
MSDQYDLEASVVELDINSTVDNSSKVSYVLSSYSANRKKIEVNPPRLLINYKETLKAKGCTWNASYQAWTFENGMTETIDAIMQNIVRGVQPKDNNIDINYEKKSSSSTGSYTKRATNKQFVFFEVASVAVDDQWMIIFDKDPTLWTTKSVVQGGTVNKPFVKSFTITNGNEDRLVIIHDFEWKIEGETRQHTLKKLI